MNKKPRVFVGVSGGVDSSVALALLKQATPNNFKKLFGRPTPKRFRGYDVVGVFLKVWSPDFLPCNWKEERRSAMRVCATLGVPFMTLDCEKEHKKEVVDYMIREYKNGRVPNPDVFCNKYVKFGVFLKKVRALGGDYIATGHYAQTRTRSGTNADKRGQNIIELLEGTDKNKDQSYFLYTLNQKQLSHTLFPIGHLTKPEVRKLAKKFNLPTAEKKDSQGLCFIGKVDMKDFLTHYIKTKAGKVLNTEREIIGVHDGAVLYTIGQRHGFTITKKSTQEPRYFIISKDLKKNTITIANKGAEKDKVYSIEKITLPDVHFIDVEKPKLPLKAFVRIRYRQEKQKCILDKKSGKYLIKFDKAQNAISTGQCAVLYQGDICLGGGIIEKTL